MSHPTQQQPHSPNSISIRIQRKVLSKLSTPKIAKHVLPDSAVHLFDALYAILVKYYPEKAAEKTIKNIIKIVVKLMHVFADEKMVDEHEYKLEAVQEAFRHLILTFQTFDDESYFYNSARLLELLKGAEEATLNLVRSVNLSDKSAQRVHFIFEHFNNTKMLDSLFAANGEHHQERRRIVDAIEDLNF